MKTTAHSFLSLSLLASAYGLVGCGSEKIDADFAYLSNGHTSTTAPGTHLEIIFAPDPSVEMGQEFPLRIDGRPVLFSPGDRRTLTLSPGVQLSGQADELVASSHIFQVVDSQGKSRLTTAPLDLTPGRANQLVVYGNKDKLDYMFFANTDAELASVSPGMVLARVINLNAGYQTFPLRLCPAVSNPTYASLADCTIVADTLSYGQLWQAIVPRESAVAVPCDSSDTICYWYPLGPSRCAPQYTNVPTQITLYGMGAFNAYFVAHELAFQDTCFP